MKRYTAAIVLPVGRHEFFVRAENAGHALRLAAEQLDRRGFKPQDVKGIWVVENKGDEGE